ncbi:MAG: hypothetical protein ACD_49C00009G0003 [uncultured bacterium (gcode 4)]|uniref:Thioredoxin domain-containing protein n=1 Tax=uncultured bacterium (gcode 4) TaxID=1234023 RepID=K2BDC5_9BACT|nr:MAG: hypothetical protein ACD_49C00009G0003 [uncultured bacterium (gcode 4)]
MWMRDKAQWIWAKTLDLGKLVWSKVSTLAEAKVWEIKGKVCKSIDEVKKGDIWTQTRVIWEEIAELGSMVWDKVSQTIENAREKLWKTEIWAKSLEIWDDIVDLVRLFWEEFINLAKELQAEIIEIYNEIICEWLNTSSIALNNLDDFKEVQYKETLAMLFLGNDTNSSKITKTIPLTLVKSISKKVTLKTCDINKAMAVSDLFWVRKSPAVVIYKNGQPYKKIEKLKEVKAYLNNFEA